MASPSPGRICPPKACPSGSARIGRSVGIATWRSSSAASDRISSHGSGPTWARSHANEVEGVLSPHRAIGAAAGDEAQGSVDRDPRPGRDRRPSPVAARGVRAGGREPAPAPSHHRCRWRAAPLRHRGPRHPARLGLGPARRDRHRGLRSPPGVPGGRVRGADARQRPGPRRLRRGPRVVRPSRPGPPRAVRCAPASGRRTPRRAPGRDRGWESARGPATRDLPGGRPRRRGPRRDGRVLPDGRAIPDLEGARRQRAVRSHQRRDGPHHPRRAEGRRLPLRADHAGDAGDRAAAAAAAPARRPSRGLLHSGGLAVGRRGRHRRGRSPPLPRRHGRGHALPAAHRHPGGDHRIRVVGRPPEHRGEGPGCARRDRHLSHDRSRQDRHPHLRRAHAQLGTQLFRLLRRGRVGRLPEINPLNRLALWSPCPGLARGLVSSRLEDSHGAARHPPKEGS